MADTSNIKKLLQVASSPQKDGDQPVAEPSPTPPVVKVLPPQNGEKPVVTPEMLEFSKEQIYQNLKASKKPVSKMTETEKIIFAEKEQKMIEDYEMFTNGTVSYMPARYSGKGGVFFSPVASTVLDEFFTNGQN